MYTHTPNKRKCIFLHVHINVIVWRKGGKAVWFIAESGTAQYFKRALIFLYYLTVSRQECIHASLVYLNMNLFFKELLGNLMKYIISTG